MILTGRYLPGYKDGGPVRTIKNLTDSIGDLFDISVVCADRDHGDEESYTGVQINEFNKVGNASVFYVENGQFSFSLIKKLANQHDLLYVCGPYNSYAIKALILKRLGLITCPLVLAPMGSFSKGALALKSRKKQIFLFVMKILGLLRNISFSVTSRVEEGELKETLGNKKCFIAEDMPRKPQLIKEKKQHKKDDALNIVFLSRICEKKNLSMAIDILSLLDQSISFHIYGNIEDQEYWEKCHKKLSMLPDNIRWKYMGELDSEKVVVTLSAYDVFLFPTLGENFGHVISEAMSAGCIPLLSDTTPWLDLEEYQAGFVLPLIEAGENNNAGFAEKITRICKMTEEQLSEMSGNAIMYSERKYKAAVNNNGYVEMFNELIR